MDYSTRPKPTGHSEYHQAFINKAPDGDITELLTQQVDSFSEFVNSIPSDQSGVVHSPYGWSVRQVVEHCLDTERVFGYRMLRFGAGDKTALPSWEQDDYAAADYGPNADLKQLADEFCWQRKSNIGLLRRMSPEAWEEIGTADEKQVAVRSMAWLLAGHLIHHVDILKQRLAT